MFGCLVTPICWRNLYPFTPPPNVYFFFMIIIFFLFPVLYNCQSHTSNSVSMFTPAPPFYYLFFSSKNNNTKKNRISDRIAGKKRVTINSGALSAWVLLSLSFNSLYRSKL